MKINLR